MQKTETGGLGLTRRPGESIVLQGAADVPVRVTVESISRGQVKLRIQAPPEVTIVREELLTRAAS
jgi:carbon storage regulator CsrA